MLHTRAVTQTSESISSNLVPAVKEWEVLAQESLDAVLEPNADTAADGSELGLNDASITWRGDGKYFATVSLPAGKALLLLQLQGWTWHDTCGTNRICLKRLSAVEF